MKMEIETAPQPPKAMKVMIVAAFFMLLFFLAGTIGLPVPVGLVFGFFITMVVPGAFVLALISTAIYKAATKGNKTIRWPLFDVGLQSFIVLALIATGIFIIRLPAWLKEGYPSIREEVSRQLSPDHAPLDREHFLVSLDRFWEWNVKILLQEGNPPSDEQQQNVRETVTRFGEAMAPDCETCEPQLSLKETRELSRMMNSITTSAATRPTEIGTTPIAMMPPPMTTPMTAATAVSDVTSPTAVTQTP